MKKVLLLTVVALFVMMPFASFAKTAISDSDLSALTAQTGVSIDFGTNGVSISNVSIALQSWGDSDGFGTYTSAGFIGAVITMGGNVLGLSGVMNIDVGTSGSVTKLNIALPTIAIGGTNFTQDQTIKLAGDKTLTSIPLTLGESYMSGLTASVTGQLTIYAH